jgi:hypothetical protein
LNGDYLTVDVLLSRVQRVFLGRLWVQCDLQLVLEIVSELQLVVLLFSLQVLEKQGVCGIEIEVHLDGPGKTVAHKAKV